ncbi:MAG TPA: hypothetical protein VLH81_10465 [Desulfobacterales bacterium]|nr:hypothetical protein [Desulfobacterales bacterium]
MQFSTFIIVVVFGAVCGWVWHLAWLRRRNKSCPTPEPRPADHRPGGRPKPPTE